MADATCLQADFSMNADQESVALAAIKAFDADDPLGRLFPSPLARPVQAFESFEEFLLAAGWRVERDADGAIRRLHQESTTSAGLDLAWAEIVAPHVASGTMVFTCEDEKWVWVFENGQHMTWDWDEYCASNPEQGL